MTIEIDKKIYSLYDLIVSHSKNNAEFEGIYSSFKNLAIDYVTICGKKDKLYPKLDMCYLDMANYLTSKLSVDSKVVSLEKEDIHSLAGLIVLKEVMHL